MDLNKVSLIGNLVKEPVSRQVSGQTVARFAVATNYIWKDAKTKTKKESVEYHNVVTYGKLAEIVSQYIKKGSKVYLEGRLTTRSWKDKSGDRRSMTEMVADELIMLGRKEKSEPADNALAKEEPDNDELAVEDDAA